MKNVRTLPLIAAAATILLCVAAAPLASGAAADLTAVDTDAARTVLAQSPGDYGACYTWNRLNPFQEMCNQTTRDYCDTSNSVFIGSRFVEGGVCPDNS